MYMDCVETRPPNSCAAPHMALWRETMFAEQRARHHIIREGPMLTRRQVLTGVAATAGAAALPSAFVGSAALAGPASGPFALGVASGDPLPDAVILWTRLVQPTGLASPRPVEVGWQVARDERLRHVVRSGRAIARPELAHSVHVDARGLKPGREYFYRFRVGQHISPVGRTKTAPSRWANPDRLRFGMVSCQDFQNGYWPAYTGLAAEDLDLVLHLGDYIYEYDPNSVFPDRKHSTPAILGLDQLRTLDDYRNRHAQ